jgi:hypothetical protein
MNDADKANQAVQKQTKTLTTVKGKKKKSRDFHRTCKTGPKKRGVKKKPHRKREGNAEGRSKRTTKTKTWRREGEEKTMIQDLQGNHKGKKQLGRRGGKA